jgi:YggT family protein
LQDQMPLLAILILLLLRGLLIWIVGAGYPIAHYQSFPLVFRRNLLNGLLLSMADSFTMGVILVTQLLIAVQFISMVISRSGIIMAGNAGYACFKEKTFAIFQFTQKFSKTDDLRRLFYISGLTIWVAGAILAVFTSLSFLYGIGAMQRVFFLALMQIVLGLINFYVLVLIVAIIASWIGADRFSVVVQIIHALTEPFLGFFRRVFPWARIDFIDLSPIFGFIALMILSWIIQSLLASAMFALNFNQLPIT